MESTHTRLTELTFQVIVESSPNSIMLVNKEGKIAYVNMQTERLFGYSRGELIGQLVEMLIPKRFSSRHPNFRDNFFAMPSIRSMGSGRELFAVRKDATEFPIEIGLTPIVTVDGTMILASIIDISERKRAEERFRLVVESAPNAMILADSNGMMTLINKQVEYLFGYDRLELIGQKLEMLLPQRFVKDHPKHRAGYFDRPQTRAMGSGRELYGLHKNGAEIPVEIGLNPIETAEGTLVLASIIDITQRKLQEESQKKQVELEARNKELEQFAYVASHDLQEPLRTVSNYMSVFEEDYSSQLDDQAKKYIQSVNNATKRMSLIVKSLLDFSRLGRNSTRSRVDCASLVQNVIDDLQRTIDTSGAKIEVDPLPTLNAYEVELGQLFQNLVSNAIKFQPPNRTPVVRISAERVKAKWIFCVTDNGIGIAPRHQHRIFNIFQRLHAHGEYEGNGIGLANCKKIIELHQGEIWIQSEEGKGSSFFFSIPQNVKS